MQFGQAKRRPFVLEELAESFICSKCFFLFGTNKTEQI